MLVAPVRERGLKLKKRKLVSQPITGRSREGAWIEIINAQKQGAYIDGRSREGAWIEIT